MGFATLAKPNVNTEEALAKSRGAEANAGRTELCGPVPLRERCEEFAESVPDDGRLRAKRRTQRYGNTSRRQVPGMISISLPAANPGGG